MLIRRAEQGLDGGRRQVARCPQHGPLAGDVEYPLRDGERAGITRGDVAEKGPDGCESGIARAGPVAALAFEGRRLSAP
jgi:hypothetical protein